MAPQRECSDTHNLHRGFVRHATKKIDYTVPHRERSNTYKKKNFHEFEICTAPQQERSDTHNLRNVPPRAFTPQQERPDRRNLRKGFRREPWNTSPQKGLRMLRASCFCASALSKLLRASAEQHALHECSAQALCAHIGLCKLFPACVLFSIYIMLRFLCSFYLSIARARALRTHFVHSRPEIRESGSHIAFVLELCKNRRALKIPMTSKREWFVTRNLQRIFHDVFWSLPRAITRGIQHTISVVPRELRNFPRRQNESDLSRAIPAEHFSTCFEIRTRP